VNLLVGADERVDQLAAHGLGAEQVWQLRGVSASLCVPGGPVITEPLAAVPDTGWCPGSSEPRDYDVRMTAPPVNVTAALASFDKTYSPRIVARMNDYEVRVAHAKGEHV